MPPARGHGLADARAKRPILAMWVAPPARPASRPPHSRVTTPAGSPPPDESIHLRAIGPTSWESPRCERRNRSICEDGLHIGRHRRPHRGCYFGLLRCNAASLCKVTQSHIWNREGPCSRAFRVSSVCPTAPLCAGKMAFLGHGVVENTSLGG